MGRERNWLGVAIGRDVLDLEDDGLLVHGPSVQWPRPGQWPLLAAAHARLASIVVAWPAMLGQGMA
jgi:hypothetical protein